MKSLILFFAVFSALIIKIAVEKRLHPELLSPSNLTPIQAGYQSESMKRYSFGFENAFGALIWVDLGQRANHRPLKRDEVSWEYAQFDCITTLDPNFEEAYHLGGLFTSAFRKDKLGGKLLLEKWVAHRPHFWRSNFMLGSHHYLELNDRNAAAPYIIKASLMPNAPQWLSSVGVRLLSESGGSLQALVAATELYGRISDLEAKYRLRVRIRALNYNLQLSGWKEALQAYESEKKRPPATLSELSPYLPSPSRELSSITQTAVKDPITTLLKERFVFEIDPISHTIEPRDRSLSQVLGRTGIYNSPTPGQ